MSDLFRSETGSSHPLPVIQSIANEDLRPRLSRLIREINQRLNSDTRFERVLEFAFDSLGALIPFDRIGIATIENGGKIARLIWMKSKTPAAHLRKNYSCSIEGSSLEKILTTGTPRILNDLAQYLVEHPTSVSTRLVFKDGIRSSLTCPLISKAKPIGFVFFSSNRPNTYATAHVDTFSEIAEELSVVVEQGRLRDFFEKHKTKDQMLGTVVHDLKSPLSIIQGFIETLVEEPWYEELTTDSKDIFATLLRNTRFMFGLIDELAMVHQTDHESILELQNVDLREFCSELAVYGDLLAGKKGIEFVENVDSSLPERVQFDSRRLRQVLENLFTNAVKFSMPGSKIILAVRSDHEKIEFSVTDHGQGIPETDLPKLFHEFGKTSVRPTAGESSTGLGLAIAKKIVEKHGGKIFVESKVGCGSTFRFWIPNVDDSLH